jgi:hypothetical protein
MAKVSIQVRSGTARFAVAVQAHSIYRALSIVAARRRGTVARACYELAQEWLTNAENGGPTRNRANRVTRILMRFFSQVHNSL